MQSVLTISIESRICSSSFEEEAGKSRYMVKALSLDYNEEDQKTFDCKVRELVKCCRKEDLDCFVSKETNNIFKTLNFMIFMTSYQQNKPSAWSTMQQRKG